MRIVDVQTGDVEVLCGSGCVCTSAIGSCVAVMMLDTEHHVGGIAHIMLPGSAPPGCAAHPLRYTSNGISRLLLLMQQGGARIHSLITAIAGGGNVLQKPDDTICRDNIFSVESFLAHNHIRLYAASTGGVCRRTGRVNLDEGSITCCVGDGPETILWQKQTTESYTDSRVLKSDVMI